MQVLAGDRQERVQGTALFNEKGRPHPPPLDRGGEEEDQGAGPHARGRYKETKFDVFFSRKVLYFLQKKNS